MDTGIVVGVLVLTCAVAIQSVASAAVARVAARVSHRGLLGHRLWADAAVLELTALVLAGSFLIQMALWAVVLCLVGEFHDYGPAFYHSASCYTTLGGRLQMSERWRILEPIEAANGVLMGGHAAAVLYAVTRQLIDGRRKRLEDSRNGPTSHG